jgi:hypothetical protein
LPEPLGPGDLPPHAYVPGKTARHPEALFDRLKEGVSPSLPPEAMTQTAAWQAGLLFFREGYFWECHEVLEAAWMALPEGAPEREVTQALIQLANARLKLRMSRPRAALRLCDMVLAHLARCDGAQAILGLSLADLRAEVETTRQAGESAN